MALILAGHIGTGTEVIPSKRAITMEDEAGSINTKEMTACYHNAILVVAMIDGGWWPVISHLIRSPLEAHELAVVPLEPVSYTGLSILS